MSRVRPAFLLLLALAAVPVVAQPPSAEEAAAPPAAQMPSTAQAPPATPAPVKTLDELLQRVRAGKLHESAADAEREQRFLAEREQQQATLKAARQELAESQKRAATLEKKWETNQQQLTEQQAALRTRLGSLADVFAELGAVGPELRQRLRDSPTAPQVGVERLAALDSLLETVASGVRLPPIADWERLWFELQRELAESSRIRRFEVEVTAADGTRGNAVVVRAGNFALVDADGTYLLYDGAEGRLQRPARELRATMREEAAALALANGGLHPFTLDPTTARGASALRAALAAPTLAERLRAGGAIAWITILLGTAACVFALYRVLVLERLRGRIGAESAAAPQHPLGSLRALALQQVQLDAGALEHALHEAVLHELPALERGLAWLRTIGTALPLLGVLGTVLALASGAGHDTLSEPGARLFTSGLAQALLSTVLGVIGGIAVLLLQAVLAARTRDFVLLLEEEAAALVTARAMGAI